MEVKEKHWVLLIFVIVVAVCGYIWFNKTSQIRRYKGEIEQLELISEHQALEIEVAEQSKELARLKAEAERGKPTYKLTPKPKEEEE